MSSHGNHVTEFASPDSSEAVESQHVTPATKLSAFSPDNTRVSPSSGGRGIVRAKIPPPFDLDNLPSSFRFKSPNDRSGGLGSVDPFVSATSFTPSTARSSIDPSRLSPAAAAFTPATVLDSPSGDQSEALTDETLVVNVSGTNATGPLSPADASGPDIKGDHFVGTQEHATSSSTNILTPERSCSDLKSFSAGKPQNRFSTDDGRSRFLMVTVGINTSAEAVEQYFTRQNYSSLLTLDTSELSARGVVFLIFADIRDAEKAFSDQSLRRVRYLSLFDLLQRESFKDQSYMTEHASEGQIIIQLDYFGHARQFDELQLTHAAKNMIDRFGDVLAFQVMVSGDSKLTIKVEYYDTRNAHDLLSNKDEFKLPMCALKIEPYKTEINSGKNSAAIYPGPVIIGRDDVSVNDAMSAMHLGKSYDHNRLRNEQLGQNQTPPFAASITGRKESIGLHTPSPLGGLGQGYVAPAAMYSPSWSSPIGPYAMSSPLWSPYSPGAIGQERSSPSPSLRPRDIYPTPRTPSAVAKRQTVDFITANHNVVEVERIRAGLDVRTTIMLRNIPNKIDQAMLKDIIDETSLGKYDFMYLRIDFANNCNVGYAFVNFADPIYIVDFVTARAGHRWNRYNSDKVAEVSYATIQGRDCLIQKFRNSSVMLEHPSFRPKLFITGTGSNVGMEEKFPGPDNASKMRRSVENAEHVGLFAPRAGQSFRDEQRRRRSQFDRGTRITSIDENIEASHYGIRAGAQEDRLFKPIPSFEQTFQGYSSPYH